MQDGKLSSEKSHQMLNSWLNSLSWPWDPVSQLSKLWQSTLLDACSPQVSRTPGTFLELFTMLLINSNTKESFSNTSTNTTHTSALAPMMPTTFLSFLETTTPVNKPFSATALKLQAILSLQNEQQLNESDLRNQISFYTSTSALYYLFMHRC